MSNITDDDYFRDVSQPSSEAVLIQAGYKIPKKTISIENYIKQQNGIESETPDNSCEQSVNFPKALSTEILKGDLTNQAVPIPMNYHEGGLFTDHDSTQSEISTNPFKTTPMVTDELGLAKVTMGSDQLIIARGSNNIHGQAGFYSAVFKAGKFGHYPSETQPIVYDSNANLNVIAETKLSQITEEALAKNDAIFSVNVEGQHLSNSEETLPPALDRLIENPPERRHSKPHLTVSIPNESELESSANLVNKLMERIERQEQVIQELTLSKDLQTQVILHLEASIQDLKQSRDTQTQVILDTGDAVQELIISRNNQTQAIIDMGEVIKTLCNTKLPKDNDDINKSNLLTTMVKKLKFW